MMLILAVFTCIGIVSIGGCVEAEASYSEACQSWEFLRKEAENFSDVQLLCNINNYCTGVFCSGKYENYKGNLEVRVQHCKPPVSVEIHLSVPLLNIMNWSKVFVHGERVPIPKSMYDAQSNDKSFIEVYLAPTNDSASVNFGVDIISHSLLGKDGNPVSVVLLKNETVKFPPCPYKKGDPSSFIAKSAVRSQSQSIPLFADKREPVIQKLEIPAFSIQHADTVKSSSCNLLSFNPCNEGEICELQKPSDKDGVCNCLPNYYRNSSGICQSNLPVPSSTASPGGPNPQADTAPRQSPSQNAISIAVPVVIIVVLSTLVVLAYKYRWIVKLRARFLPSRRYEEMVIDGDEVGDMQSSGSDPVA